MTSEVFSGQAGSAWLSGGYPVPAGQVIVQFAGERGYHLGALLRRQRWPRCDGGAPKFSLRMIYRHGSRRTARNSTTRSARARES